MELLFDTALMKVFDTAFEVSECFMLLPEQNLDWWEGNINNLTVIYGLKDLAVALYRGLDEFDYERLPGEEIKMEKGDDVRWLLDLPFREKLIANAQGVTRFILYPLKGSSDALAK